jgi:dTDP-4-dehydrorhamnose 3,5-epimerase
VIFTETPLAGAFAVDPEPVGDERGSFARTFCTEEFARLGLEPAVAQCNVSTNVRRGTLRGLHWQEAPYGEAKLVRCTAGAIHDVIVDLRPESPTFCHWHAVQLSAENGRALYVPRGFAHGFQTVADGSEVLYQMSTPFVPGAARGIRYDDPRFAIGWLLPVAVVSERDASYPDFVT